MSPDKSHTRHSACPHVTPGGGGVSVSAWRVVTVTSHRCVPARSSAAETNVERVGGRFIDSGVAEISAHYAAPSELG